MAEGAKKLYRSQDQKMLGGVCGGLGEYFNIDPIIVRLIFVAFALVAGGGLLLYLIMWLLIPQEPGADVPEPQAEE
ncbi:MAG: PspC domain-containing protein [Anaerolineales bacterium]